jgi:dienelactone hydrolase
MTTPGRRSAGVRAPKVRVALVLAAVVLAAATLVACGAPMNVAVTVRTLTIVDSSRGTPARGFQPALPARTLPTWVWKPSSGGPWPLIVFAHGFDVNPLTYQTLLSAWAAAGYVVAAPEFPISGSDGDSYGLPREDDGSNQPGDLSTVISHLLADPAYAPSIDAGHIGVAGHSDGGETAAAMALNSAYHDPRVSAFEALSGALAGVDGGTWGPSNAGALLAVSGDQDPNYAHARQVAETARAPRGFMAIIGGGHLPPYIEDSDQGRQVRAATVDFWNRWLRGDVYAGTWLVNDASRAGVTRLEISSL